MEQPHPMAKPQLLCGFLLLQAEKNKQSKFTENVCRFYDRVQFVAVISIIPRLKCSFATPPYVGIDAKRNFYNKKS